MQLHSLSLRSHMGVSCGLKNSVKSENLPLKSIFFYDLVRYCCQKEGRDMRHLCGNKITMSSLGVQHTSCLYFHEVKIDAIR